ncbi:MAG TPA: hypothetical protein VKW78_04870 [Terriglobales bacterium]|nr:hypothetical protein [Terriglobales bacterium]
MTQGDMADLMTKHARQLSFVISGLDKPAIYIREPPGSAKALIALSFTALN